MSTKATATSVTIPGTACAMAAHSFMSVQEGCSTGRELLCLTPGSEPASVRGRGTPERDRGHRAAGRAARHGEPGSGPVSFYGAPGPAMAGTAPPILAVPEVRA